MSYRIIDRPHFVDTDGYKRAIDTMLNRLSKLEQVTTIYNIGSVSSPGISDLDMVVVSKENATISANFLNDLSEQDRYLFIHNLYAISETHFTTSEQFTFFHNYSLAYGTDIRQHHSPSPADIPVLKKQVAKEFIVKMYMQLYIQQTYKVLRMRDLLLHVKALQYDFDFLGIETGKVVELVQQLIHWRKIWFTDQPQKKEIISWWKEFYSAFEKFTIEVLAENTFYVPGKPYFRIARNIVLKPVTNSLTSTHSGTLLPSVLSLAGKRFFKLQNRLNNFEFAIPSRATDIPEVLKKKFLFETELREYGRRHLPHFLPLTSSLHLQ